MWSCRCRSRLDAHGRRYGSQQREDLVGQDLHLQLLHGGAAGEVLRHVGEGDALVPLRLDLVRVARVRAPTCDTATVRLLHLDGRNRGPEGAGEEEAAALVAHAAVGVVPGEVEQERQRHGERQEVVDVAIVKYITIANPVSGSVLSRELTGTVAVMSLQAKEPFL